MKIINIILVIFYFLFFLISCHKEKKIEILLESEKLVDKFELVNAIKDSKDSNYYWYLLDRENIFRVSHNFKYYGMSLYQLKMNALREISGMNPPNKINYRFDSINYNFYYKWGLKNIDSLNIKLEINRMKNFELSQLTDKRLEGKWRVFKFIENEKGKFEQPELDRIKKADLIITSNKCYFPDLEFMDSCSNFTYSFKEPGKRIKKILKKDYGIPDKINLFIIESNCYGYSIPKLYYNDTIICNNGGVTTWRYRVTK